MKIGDIVIGKVKSISKNYFWVDLPAEYQGVVFINEISDYFVRDIHTMLKIGDCIKLEVLTCNFNNKKASLSYKNLRPKLLKNPFVFELKETKNGFKNLLKHAQDEVKNWKE